MELEERLQIGLAAIEEIANEKSKGPGHHQEDDDEDIGKGRREIARKLAPKNDERAAHVRED